MHAHTLKLFISFLCRCHLMDESVTAALRLLLLLLVTLTEQLDLQG